MIKVLPDVRETVDAEIVSEGNTPDNLVSAQDEPVKKKSGPHITKFFPAEAVEGLLSMMLAHINRSLDFVHEGKLKLKKI